MSQNLDSRKCADEHSDSEESNTNSVPHQHHHHPHHHHQQHPKGYQQKSYYNRFTYSSQSTPTRRYQQYDSTKSTRSSSTASETKITFNEDEYTRITTPRQDVLFKKGYLNKPKTYQTQTSTGTSTTSTGNSTGNGTPDHQSTDLEYESQFVFPNGFLDQNGIYYVNSYEGYPLMLYNPPTTYYHDFSNVKSKRYSTGSLTESTSPNTEETTSQEPSQSETPNNPSELNNHHPSSYNIVYPGFYYNGNGPCQSQDSVDQSTTPTEPSRRLKKKKRRKPSSSPHQQQSTEPHQKKDEETEENGCTTSEYTDAEEESSYSDDEEIFLNKHAAALVTPNPTLETDVAAQSYHRAENVSVKEGETGNSNTATTEDRKIIDAQKLLLESLISVEQKESKEEGEEATITNGHVASADEQRLEENRVVTVDKNSQQSHLLEDKNEGQQQSTCLQQQEGASCSNKSFALKPDAEEFIPRAYRRRPESIPFDPGVHPHHQFIKMGPPNFVPVPILSPMTAAEFQGHHHHHHPNFTHHHHHPAAAFIPPGIPINFVPHHQNFINFVPSNTNNNTTDNNSNGNYSNCNGDMEREGSIEQAGIENCPQEDVVEKEQINKDRAQVEEAKTVAKIEDNIQQQVPNKDKKNIDISTIVSKLEEAAKEQNEDVPSQNGEEPPLRPANEINSSQQTSPVHCANKDVTTSNNRSNNAFGRNNNNYGKFRNSNNRRMHTNNTDDYTRTTDSTNQRRPFNNRFDPERRRRPNWKPQPLSSPKKEPYTKGLPNGVPSSPVVAAASRNYSETLKKTQTMSAQQFPSLSSGESRNEISLSNEQTSKQQPEDKTGQVTSGEVKKAVVQTNNQWIPVSSKKKRKNRNNVEELDEEFEETISTTTVSENKDEGLFESYDVTLLEDVVVHPAPPSQIAVIEKTEEIVRVIPEVDGKPPKIEVESIKIEVIAEKVLLDQKPKTEDPTPKEDKLKTAKKKSKKGFNKSTAKRVIITDIDLSSEMAAEPVIPAPVITPTAAAVNDEEDVEAVAQPKEKEIPEVATPEAIIIASEPVENRLNTEDESAPTAAESLQPKVETEPKKGDKKSMKKKKKKTQAKPSLLHSQSNSSSNLNLTDDSYDFLLETSTLDDSSEKTNVEVSQELDKLIQRGMYSNLEEKIKSLNMPDVTDGFFKTIIGNISRTSRESSIEKTNYIRTAADFGSILMKNTALSRPKFPIVDAPSTSRQQHSTPSTSSLMGDFLGVGSPILGESQLKIEDAQTECCQQRLTQNDSKIEQQPQFPITQAVKEWVNKTRENTPEVEIFKSPSTIFKEFALNEDDNQIQEELLDGEEEEDDVEAETDQKNATGNSLHAESPENAGEQKGVAKSDSDAIKSDDEVTLYSREQSVDLLQCWEDEPPATPNEPTPTSDVSVALAPEHTKAGITPKMDVNGVIRPPKTDSQNDPDLVGDSIEIYESKYGRNEDYLRIKAEVEMKQQNGGTATTNAYPRHGNLPYRAVCCSIM